MGGIDKTGPHLIESDPSGMLYEWQCYAIGRGAQLANKIFKQKWRSTMGEKEAIMLAIEVMQKTEKERKDLDIAVIKKDSRFRKVTEDEAKKMK